jgi:CubicO group peptidase (beta-lactamase class C family)
VTRDRHEEPRSVVVGLSLEALERALAAACNAGAGIASLSVYGEPSDLRYAVVFEQRDHPIEQRVVGGVAPSRLAPLARAQAASSWYPVRVAASGAGRDARGAVVLERGDGPPTRLVAPRPIRDASGTFGETGLDPSERDEALVLDAAVFGDTGATGASAEVVCVVGPRTVTRGRVRPSATRLAWAVHVDQVAPGGTCWSRLDAVTTLATCARPVRIGRLGDRWVWSLWRDDMHEPWPEPDPFARGGRFVIDEYVPEALLAERIDRRRTEGRRPLAVGSSGHGDDARFDVLYGADAPATRSWSISPPQDARAPARLDVLDTWMRETMERGGARHGQLAVVRGSKVVLARACTLAEPGYPRAHRHQPMRLGSVTKAVTAIAWMIALRERPLERGLDTPLGSQQLLDLDPARSGALADVTLRHLMQHDAGLAAWSDLRHDEAGRALSEVSLAREVGRIRPIALPGETLASLGRLPSARVLARAPGGAAPGRFVYSNEGFILLGELLAKHVTGSAARLGDALRELLPGIGLDAIGEPWLGSGRLAARERGESPAHPLSPTWAPARFAEQDGAQTALASYDYNGCFLGGAAGLSLPALVLARLLAALGPRPDAATLLTRSELAELATPADATARAPAHGFHLGERGWWPTRRPGRPPLPHRFVRLAHNGRIDGGTAFLAYQMPEQQVDDGDDTTLGLVVAFNALFPLHEDPHGRALFTILRGLEESGALAELQNCCCGGSD